MQNLMKNLVIKIINFLRGCRCSIKAKPIILLGVAFSPAAAPSFVNS